MVEAAGIEYAACVDFRGLERGGSDKAAIWTHVLAQSASALDPANGFASGIHLP